MEKLTKVYVQMQAKLQDQDRGVRGSAREYLDVAKIVHRFEQAIPSQPAARQFAVLGLEKAILDNETQTPLRPKEFG